jgi:SAM-dependent methyltransferase
MRLQIELDAEPAVLDAMLARTGDYWQAAGQEAPHWSVLTNDRFRPEAIEEHKAAFYGSGVVEAETLAGILERHGTTAEEVGRCVEFGCGVGRVTIPLARRFRRVIACDVSAAHIAVAKEEAAARRVRNIGWHVSTVAEPQPPGHYPLWFSRIVLQHNPPPVQVRLLRQAFRGLAAGGFAVFQLVTHRLGYRFAMEEYLARSGPPRMEMHVLPQDAVFRLVAEARLEVLDVREDLVVSSNRERWMSNLFVVRRPPRRVA